MEGRKMRREHDFCQAQKAENADPRTNYAVKYATARGHRTLGSKGHAREREGKAYTWETHFFTTTDSGADALGRSTGKTNASKKTPGKGPRHPRDYCQYWCEIWVKFLTSNAIRDENIT